MTTAFCSCDEDSEVSWATLSKGDVVFEESYSVARSDLVRYAGASGDFNPIHWSERVATSVGLPGVIAHGMFTMALAGRAVSSWVKDTARITSLTSRFTKPVVVPDGEVATVTIALAVHSVDDGHAGVTLAITAKHDGNAVLGKARAHVVAPTTWKQSAD